MNLIIWGLVCVFLDVNLPIGPVTIDIIPDFFGFILILEYEPLMKYLKGDY